MVCKTYLLFVNLLLINLVHASDDSGYDRSGSDSASDVKSFKKFSGAPASGASNKRLAFLVSKSIPDKSLLAYLIACEKTKQAKLDLRKAQIKFKTAKLQSSSIAMPSDNNLSDTTPGAQRVNLLVRDQSVVVGQEPDQVSLGQKIIEQVGSSPRSIFVVGLLAGASLFAGGLHLKKNPEAIRIRSNLFFGNKND